MKTPESYEKEDIDKYLESIGAANFKPATGGFGKSGCPDRLVCIRKVSSAEGGFWGIEVKREGKEPTALQWERIKEIEKAGGKATWGTAERVIKEIERWRNM